MTKQFVKWNNISRHFKNTELDEFIIMPNHIHGIIIIVDVGAKHFLKCSKIEMSHLF